MSLEKYQELMKKALTVRWKTEVCQSGDACWCRMISLEEQLEEDSDGDVYVVAGGAINKIHAEHIVKIHNEQISKIIIDPDKVIISKPRMVKEGGRTKNK